MDLTALTVEFSGGVITGVGTFTLHEGELLSVDDEGVIRTGHAVVEIEFLEPGLVRYDNGDMAELAPGAYVISGDYGIVPATKSAH